MLDFAEPERWWRCSLRTDEVRSWTSGSVVKMGSVRSNV
jgi:hypothetical protein